MFTTGICKHKTQGEGVRDLSRPDSPVDAVPTQGRNIARIPKRGRFRRCLALDGLDNCSSNLFDGSDWASQGELIFHNAFISALGKEESAVGYSQTGVVLKAYQRGFGRKFREKEKPKSAVSRMTNVCHRRK